MKERPILFSGDMVRAILEGRKTQTRRIVKLQGTEAVSPYPGLVMMWVADDFTGHFHGVKCPYGQPGDRLWVRETWRTEELIEGGLDGVRYKAGLRFQPIENTAEASLRWCVTNDNRNDWMVNKWRPSIFMPRWVSRITLEVTGVRVERLQSIGHDDALAEGVVVRVIEDYTPYSTGSIYVDAYAQLWDKINGKKHPWDSNPWVWVIEFFALGGDK